jgi:hypothetical protein
MKLLTVTFLAMANAEGRRQQAVTADVATRT